MSLVNDALKRATEAHNRRAPAPVADLPLRPVEPTRPSKNRIGLVLPATLLTIILAALFSFGLSKHDSGKMSAPPTVKSEMLGLTVAAKSPPPTDLTPVVLKDPAPAVAPPVVSAQPMAPPAPPAAAPLRLQAIFYTPPRPSAIISGQTVHVGDTLRELQVVAIGSASALLVGAQQTNFLTLE